jgi:patatin-like phospholipase/acyl hydrolase
VNSPEQAGTPFRILSVDGGGIRGLISALTIDEIETRLSRKTGREVRMADYFHLFAGTSTGGLIALALTAPKGVSAKELADFYTVDGAKIFSRTLARKLGTLWGFSGPKYSPQPLREAIERRLGDSKVSEATRDLLVTSYDMNRPRPPRPTSPRTGSTTGRSSTAASSRPTRWSRRSPKRWGARATSRRG